MLYAICSRKELSNHNFFSCVSDIISLRELDSLKYITHHISTTRFQHCLNVSYYSYIICKKLGLDFRSAARAGLLHDLFFYNRKSYNRSKSKNSPSHSRFHSMSAAENAHRLVGLSPHERSIIETHMWPATAALPRSIESFIVCFADKYCAVLEVLVPLLKKNTGIDRSS